MIFPEKVVIGITSKWTNEENPLERTIIDVEDAAYIVPLNENLKILLSNENYRSHLLKSADRIKDGVYRSYLDGSFIQNNEFFKKFPDGLEVVLYYDEVVLASPIGSAAKKYKMGMFYWILGTFFIKHNYHF